MATKTINGTKVVISNSGAAVAETEYTTDAAFNSVQYFDILAPDPRSASLWSIGTSQIAAGGWTIQGSITVPTELLAQDSAYGIDDGTYQECLWSQHIHYQYRPRRL